MFWATLLQSCNGLLGCWNRRFMVFVITRWGLLITCNVASNLELIESTDFCNGVYEEQRSWTESPTLRCYYQFLDSANAAEAIHPTFIHVNTSIVNRAGPVDYVLTFLWQ